MKSLTSEVFNFDGRDITLNWYAGSSVPNIKVSQVSAFCIYQGKLVIVRNKRGWTIPGGHPENGETIDTALERELEEEADIKKGFEAKIIGWMKVSDPLNDGREGKESAQIRFLVVTNELPEFVPDDEIFERKLINIDEFDQYISWASSPTGKAQITTLKDNLR